MAATSASGRIVSRQERQVARPDLADELQRLAAEDLAVRQRLLDRGELHGGYHLEMRSIHRRNGDRLSAILDEIGCWPGFRLVGGPGSEAAFLIAQHDIANPILMRRCRDLYEAAADLGDADPRRLAYLEDRIRYLEGRAQRYGTHLGWDETGRFGPWPPIEDPGAVDAERHHLGLPALSESIEAQRPDHALPRPVAEVIDEHRVADAFARDAGWRSSEGTDEATSVT